MKIELGRFKDKYMVFPVILNPGFIGTAFQVKHLMVEHELDVGCLYRLTVVGGFFLPSSPNGSNGLLLLVNW